MAACRIHAEGVLLVKVTDKQVALLRQLATHIASVNPDVVEMGEGSAAHENPLVLTISHLIPALKFQCNITPYKIMEK